MALSLGFIGIVATDLAASLSFYRDLGVAIPDVVEGEDHVDATLPDGTTLAWDTRELIQRLDPSYQLPHGGHRVALAFKLDAPVEVDTLYGHLIAAGHAGKVAPWDAFWGQRYASICDPDGNVIDLYAMLPAS